MGEERLKGIFGGGLILKVKKIFLSASRKKILERRKASRLGLHIRIRGELSRNRERLRDIVCRDISGSGIGFGLRTPLHKDERLKLFIYFPGHSRPVRVISQVVWCCKRTGKRQHGFDAGIRYLRIAAKERQRFLFLFCEMMLNYFLGVKIKKVRR